MNSHPLNMTLLIPFNKVEVQKQTIRAYENIQYHYILSLSPISEIDNVVNLLDKANKQLAKLNYIYN